MITITQGMTGQQFLSALNERYIQPSILVSDSANADYESLNEAISGIGALKAFRIESAIIITEDIIIPADCAFIFGMAGSISGAYTITGDNTSLVFEGKNVAIKSDVIFAGTWKTGELDIANFDVTADGATDDRAAIQQALVLTALSDVKTIIMNGQYKLSDAITPRNITIKGYPRFIGTNGKIIIYASGTIGTYYDIDSDAAFNSNLIVCSNATLLASIQEGDLLNITGELDALDSVYHGEIVEIADIDGSNIYTRQPLHITYATSDSSKIARIEPNTFSNIGQISVEYPIHLTGVTDTDKYSQGLIIYYGRDNDLNIKTFKTARVAAQFYSCFRPRIVIRAILGEMDGYGYGIGIAGPTMYADVTGYAWGFRHCVTHGGAANGIPWESYIHDFSAIGVYPGGGTCYDTHGSTGSVTFMNCRAEGQPNSVPGGFSFNGRNVRLINCEAHNFLKAIVCGDPTLGIYTIKNFRAINCSYGLLMGTGDDIASHLEIDGFTLINETAKVGNVLTFQGEVINLYVSNITGHNIAKLIYLAGTTKYPSTVVLKNLSHTNDSDSNEVSVGVTGSSIATVIIDGLINRNCGQAVLCENATSFILRNFTIENPSNVDVVKLNAAQLIVDIANGLIRTPTTANTAIVNLPEGAALLKLTDVIGDGANLDHVTKVAAEKTFTNFMHCGNIFTELVAVHETTSPATTVTSGSIGIN